MNTTKTGLLEVDRREIADRLERLPLSNWHRKLAFVVGIAVFYEFFELVLGSVLVAVLSEKWHLSTVQQASIIGAVFVGMFVGAAVGGRAADRFGRRRMFFINLLVYLVSAMLAAAAPNAEILIIFRLLAGIGAGAEMVLIDAYLSEFMPRKHRGRYITWALTCGFAAFPLVSLIGSQLATTHWAIDGWRWLMIIAGSGVIFVLWMRRNLPESPRWLVSRGRVVEADRVVSSIERQVARGRVSRATRGAAENDISAENGKDVSGASVSVGPKHRREYPKRLAMCSVLNLFGTIGYYGFTALAPMVLIAKGFDVVQSLLFTAMVSVGYPIGSILAAVVADRVERRTLIVVSAVIVSASGIVFGATTSIPVILGSGFILTVTGNGFACFVHVYMSEIFPTGARASSIGISYGVGRLGAAVLPFLGIPALNSVGPLGMLLGCAAMFAICCFIVIGFGPRATGRTVEDASDAVAT